MAGDLVGWRVLVIEDHEDTLEMLADALRRRGAEVAEASSGERALEIVRQRGFDVVVCDLELPELSGDLLLAKIREIPGFTAVPAIALTGHGGQAHRDTALRAGFAKHLLKPSSVNDLVLAVHEVAPRGPTQRSSAVVRGALARLNQSSPCRFTSVLRVADDDTLVSLWTYDRHAPEFDTFPLAQPIGASYCDLVRAHDAMVLIEDAELDPRTATHGRRFDLRCYIGIPLRRPDGGLYGTICSYDEQPHRLDADAKTALERTARELTTTLAWMIDEGAVLLEGSAS